MNDTDEQAGLLADIAHQMRAHVNLIPLNPTPLTEERTSPRIVEFRHLHQGHGDNVTIRDTRGSDIDAACGQLRVTLNTDSTPPRGLRLQ